jgi:hypothetical protein
VENQRAAEQVRYCFGTPAAEARTAAGSGNDCEISWHGLILLNNEKERKRMSFVVPELAAPVEAFATALGIGLLIGMERERRPDSAAGLRTYALVACSAACSPCWAKRPAALGADRRAGSGRRSMVASNFSSRRKSNIAASPPRRRSSSPTAWARPSGSATRRWP